MHAKPNRPRYKWEQMSRGLAKTRGWDKFVEWAALGLSTQNIEKSAHGFIWESWTRWCQAVKKEHVKRWLFTEQKCPIRGDKVSSIPVTVRTGFIHILCPDIVNSSKSFNITLALSMVLISMVESVYDAASFVTLSPSVMLIYIFLQLCPWCWFCIILLKLCPRCWFLYIGCSVHGADIIVTLSMVLILYNVVMTLSVVLIPIFCEELLHFTAAVHFLAIINWLNNWIWDFLQHILPLFYNAGLRSCRM